MKRGFLLVICVVLVGLLTGCAVYPGKGKPCVGATNTVVNVGTGISAQEENDVANALAKKAQAAQAVLATIERDGNPCYDCPPPRGVYVAPVPARSETYWARSAEPEYTTRESGESWVFKWEPAEKGYFWAITNPKYLNATPDSSRGQGVYFVGDGQGWFSKSYPMQLINGEYRVKVPVPKFLGRNRCNYLIMDGSSGDGTWALFGPSDDANWVKTGDYDTFTGTDKYCIIFQVNRDGTVVPSE